KLRRRSSSGRSPIAPWGPEPAFETRMSRPSSSSSIDWKAAATDRASVTSQRKEWQPVSCARVVKPSALRSSAATVAPARENVRTTSRPMPLAPPVTATRRPARGLCRTWWSSVRSDMTSRRLPVFEVPEHFVGVVGPCAFMNDSGERLQHRLRIGRLEDIATHVDAGGALVDREICHFQCLALGQLLAAGDDDRHRTTEDDTLEAFIDVVGFDELRAELGGNTGCEAEIAGVAGHILTHPCYRHGRDPVARAGIDQLDHVGDRLVLVFRADIDLRRHGNGADADRVIDLDGDQLVGEFGQDRVAATAAQDHRLVD